MKLDLGSLSPRHDSSRSTRPRPSAACSRNVLNNMNVFSFIIVIVAAALFIGARGAQAQRRRNSYDRYSNRGCRNRNGGQGWNGNGWSWYPDISRRACQNKCNNLGENCFGYEYGHRHCEVWKTPIFSVEFVSGLDCYVRI